MFSSDNQDLTPLTPLERRALPFIMRDGNKHCFSPPLETQACRFWRSRRSIFITHLTWGQEDKERSISRLEVVDTWVKTHNLINQVAAILTAWEIARMLEITGQPKFIDHLERVRYEGLREYFSKVQRLHYFLCSFLANIISADQRSYPPHIWAERDIPRVERALISEYVDTSLPITTFPFQVIDILRDILADHAQLIHIEELRVKFEAPIPTLFEGPVGIWRNHINKSSCYDVAKSLAERCLGMKGNARKQERDSRGRWLKSIRHSQIFKRLTSPLSSDDEATVSMTRSRSPVAAQQRRRDAFEKLEEELVEDPFKPVDDPFRDTYIFFICY